MVIFNSIKRMTESTLKREVSKAVANNIGKDRNQSETFAFTLLQTNLSKMQALAEATLDSAFKTTAYTITVSETLYSFAEENRAILYLTNGGADNRRPLKLRKKPSTGQWFLNDIQCLADIRVLASKDS